VFFGVSRIPSGTVFLESARVIEAVTHPVFTPLVEGYNLNAVRGHFASVRIHAAQPDARPTPTLVHATHVSWWDGHIVLSLARTLKLNFRVMMLESELRKYGFLRYSGAFGFTPGSAGSVKDAIRYAARQLEGPRLLLMFPSGEILPASRRPIPYQSGVASMALRAAQEFGQVNVRALALRFEHRGQARPDAFARLGAPRVVTTGTLSGLTAALREDLTLEADALETDLRTDHLDAYRETLRGFVSAQEGWDAVRRRIGVKL
jgi:1-acyl-sn-glycerol-3-phosphate acyltransferase